MIIRILCFIFRAFEALINCVTLYFTFIFNQSQYIRCCSICHKCLRNRCIKMVENATNKEKEKEKEIFDYKSTRTSSQLGLTTMQNQQ